MSILYVLALSLFWTLRRTRTLVVAGLPLMIVQNEIWLQMMKKSPLVWLIIGIHMAWLFLFLNQVRKKWPEWDSTVLERLTQAKG